jgi:hypothetical protein
MSLESELLRSRTNCRPQQNPLQTVGLSKTFWERSGMRRHSSSQTWDNKSTVKWQVRGDIKKWRRRKVNGGSLVAKSKNKTRFRVWYTCPA